MPHKDSHKDSEAVRFALHEYFQPLALSIIGGLVGVILWFGVKVYDKIESMDSKVTQVMIDVKGMSASQVELSEFKKDIKKDVDENGKDIRYIYIALAGKGITIKRDDE